jgi:hypothetical protein
MNQENIVIIAGWNTDMIVQALRIPKPGQIIQIVKNAKLPVILNLARANTLLNCWKRVKRC